MVKLSETVPLSQTPEAFTSIFWNVLSPLVFAKSKDPSIVVRPNILMVCPLRVAVAPELTLNAPATFNTLATLLPVTALEPDINKFPPTFSVIPLLGKFNVP